MSETADAVIIGGGIMGTSIALHLAEQQVGRILLFEKRFLAAGSSGKSGAILRQHYSHRTTIAMAQMGLRFYGNFSQRFHIPIGFRRAGMVFLSDEKNRLALERNVRLQKSLGVQTQIVDAQGLHALEPRGRFEDDTLAVWEAEAASVNPVRTVYGMAQAALRLGVEVRTESGVGEILLKGGKTCGVRTESRETIHAPIVVNAGGPWAARLMARLQLHYPLQAIRPLQAFWEPPGDFGDPTAIFADLRTGVYWKPEESGWTRVGKLSCDTDEPVSDPDHYDEGIDQPFIDFTRQAVAGRIPAFARAVSWGGCGALYTMTPDSHPVIGAVPDHEGLFLVSGFSGHGFKLAPAVGKGLSEIITGADCTAFDPDFFAVDRFEKGRTVKVPYSYGILG